MANTFSRIYIQTVFAVSNRMSLITPTFKEDLYKYIAELSEIRDRVNLYQRMPDHAHILIGLKALDALADLVRDIKADSSAYINKNRWVRGNFSWQEGYGAFSYGHSQLDADHLLHPESGKNIIGDDRSRRSTWVCKSFVLEAMSILSCRLRYSFLNDRRL